MPINNNFIIIAASSTTPCPKSLMVQVRTRVPVGRRYLMFIDPRVKINETIAPWCVSDSAPTDLWRVLLASAKQHTQIARHPGIGDIRVHFTSPVAPRHSRYQPGWLQNSERNLAEGLTSSKNWNGVWSISGMDCDKASFNQWVTVHHKMLLVFNVTFQYMTAHDHDAIVIIILLWICENSYLFMCLSIYLLILSISLSVSVHKKNNV